MGEDITPQMRASNKVGVALAAKYLADQSVLTAAQAAKLDVEGQGASQFQKAIIYRSEVMMDCAHMLGEYVKTL